MGVKRWLHTKLSKALASGGEGAAAPSLPVSLEGRAVLALEQRLKAQEAEFQKLKAAFLEQHGNFNRIVARTESFFQLAFIGRAIDRPSHAMMLMAYHEYDRFIQEIAGFKSLDARLDAAITWNTAQKTVLNPIYIFVEDLNLDPLMRDGDKPLLPWSKVCEIYAKVPSTTFAQTYVKNLYNNLPPILFSATNLAFPFPAVGEVAN